MPEPGWDRVRGPGAGPGPAPLSPGRWRGPASELAGPVCPLGHARPPSGVGVGEGSLPRPPALRVEGRSPGGALTELGVEVARGHPGGVVLVQEPALVALLAQPPQPVLAHHHLPPVAVPERAEPPWRHQSPELGTPSRHGRAPSPPGRASPRGSDPRCPPCVPAPGRWWRLDRGPEATRTTAAVSTGRQLAPRPHLCPDSPPCLAVLVLLKPREASPLPAPPASLSVGTPQAPRF